MKAIALYGRQCILAALCILQLCTSCNGAAKTQRTAPQQAFKNETAYFMALRAVDSHDEKSAIRLFTDGKKSANSLIRRKCAESLTQLGNVKERIEACRYLIENWDDDTVLITACSELERNNEYSMIIAATDGLDVTVANNELVRLRMNALYEKKDSRFYEEVHRWMLSRALSSFHLEIYQKYLEPITDSDARAPVLTQEQAVEHISNFASEANSESARAAAAAALALIAPTAEDSEAVAEAARANAGTATPSRATKAPTKLSREQQLLAYRVLIYRRSYAPAYQRINDIFELCDASDEELPALLISDMGKAALYGTIDYYGAARLFDRLTARLYKRLIAVNTNIQATAQAAASANSASANNADAATAPDSSDAADASVLSAADIAAYEAASKAANDALFYANFYAGRLYDKAGRYPSYMANRFKSAMEASTDGYQYDNALWYLLNAQLRGAPDEIAAALKTYSGTWHDPSYFDDFFESLSVLYISHHQWQDFYNVWKIIDQTASEETTGKYAYIAGRLLEEGLATDSEQPSTRQAITAFSRVLNGGAGLYYKVCALERLHILDEDIIEGTLCAAYRPAPDSFNEDAEAFIAACAAFGFPQQIYNEYLQYRDVIHTKTALQASQFLSQCGQYDARYNVQSLRIAARAKEYAYERSPRELVALDFPRFYAELVTQGASENNITEALLYALIRSESFFNPDVSSHSGAQGLTQLMTATAADVARKLKVESYDILDPATNVRFGAYYLGELMERVDGLPLLAIFAYNAGLTNVRRWVRQTRGDWLMSYRSRHAATGISPDLFLETLPFTETREYGRKIVSAAALYGWLYYGVSPSDTVHALMQ